MVGFICRASGACVRRIRRRQRASPPPDLWLIICSCSTHRRPAWAPLLPTNFSPLYGFIKNANEHWRLQSWSAARWGQHEKKKPINRKESSHKDRNTDVKFMPRVQGPKFIVSIGYIDYEAALVLIFIFVIKVKEK